MKNQTAQHFATLPEHSALAANVARLRCILDTAPVAIAVLQSCRVFSEVNPAMAALTGYAPAELIGRSFCLLQATDDEFDGLDKALGTMNNGQCSVETRLLCKNGDVVNVVLSVAAQVPDDPESAMTVVVQDITQRVAAGHELTAYRDHLEDLVAQRTEDLQAARQNAERLARVKSDFLANMSHEIRTPLNAVLGLAQLGLRANASEKSGPTFARILESGELLLGIINDVLDYSSINAGKLHLNLQPLELHRLVNRAVDLTSEQARHKGIRYRAITAPDLPKACLGDELRLLQVLLNLLSNAIKFTERGSVTLEVYCLSEELVFQVADTGIGMDEQQIGHLYAAFEQADSSTTRRFGGTGLGLVICKRLVDLMDGWIRVDSAPGRGSVFEVRLPLIATTLPTTKPVLEAPTGPRLTGLRVLAAEDNEVNRLLLEDILHEEGVQLSCVENGQLLVDKVISEGEAAWDIVLMDIMMPVMDGHQAARCLRELAPGLPIIGVTAHVLSDEREKCFDSGMVEHVAKPIDIDLLVEVVQRHARWKSPATKTGIQQLAPSETKATQAFEASK